MFSFGCLCHISFDGITEYATNLFPKLKSGCNCFWMIADYDKLNTVPDRQEDINIYMHLFKRKKKFLPFYYAYKIFGAKKPRFNKMKTTHPGRGGGIIQERTDVVKC
jgi:hypothetical protein